MPKQQLAVDPALSAETIATYRHFDGSLTYVHVDQGSTPNPRQGSNIATLVSSVRSGTKIDTPEPQIAKVRDELAITAQEMQLAPEKFIGDYLRKKHNVLAYRHQVHRDNGFIFWAYVLDMSWIALMGADYSGTYTPERALADEIKVYQAWCDGEVYAYLHVDTDGSVSSCGGFLAYDDLLDIATQASGVPVREQILP